MAGVTATIGVIALSNAWNPIGWAGGVVVAGPEIKDVPGVLDQAILDLSPVPVKLRKSSDHRFGPIFTHTMLWSMGCVFRDSRTTPMVRLSLAALFDFQTPEQFPNAAASAI